MNQYGNHLLFMIIICRFSYVFCVINEKMGGVYDLARELKKTGAESFRPSPCC